MTIPLIALVNTKCYRFIPKDRPNLQSLIFFGFASIDALVSITALVVGILGALSILTIPSLVSYSLIGLSTTITLLWIGFFALKCRGNAQSSQQ